MRRNSLIKLARVQAAVDAGSRRQRFAGRTWLENLEVRVMLSVTAAQLVGPIDAKGTTWTYDAAAGSTNGSSGYLREEASGLTTFNGFSAYDLALSTSYTTPTTDAGPGSTTTTHEDDYVGLTAAGAVEYGDTVTASDGSVTSDVNSSTDVGYPPELVVGQVYTTTYSTTTTETAADGTVTTSTDSEQEQLVLMSNNLTLVHTEAGPYMAYELQDTSSPIEEDGTLGDSGVTLIYLAPGVGTIETMNAEGDIGLDLESFVGGEQLAFGAQPKDAAVGAKLAPVTVKVEDGSGNVDTSSNAAVTLSLDTDSGNANATLGGTVTVDAVDGVATFSNLTVSASGDYTLSAAADGESATSSSFHVTGDHFVFVKQPKSTDVGTGIGFTVAAETSLNKVDANFSGSVQIGLNTVSGGANVTLGGVTTLSFAKGMATFAGDNAPSISAAGVYTLTAMDVADSIDVATSSPITITGLHLSFTKEPVSGDIKAPLVFTVTAENSKNKVVTTANGEVAVSLNTVSGGANATLSGDATVTLVNGVATYTVATDDAVNEPGTYTLTAAGASGASPESRAAEFRPLDSPSAFLVGISKPFTLDGFQIVFVRRITSKVSVNAPIEFQARLRDKKKNLVTSDDGNYIGVADLTEVGDGITTAINANQPFAVIEGGMATFEGSTALLIHNVSGFAMRLGEYSSVGADESADVKVTSTNDVISNIFQVMPLHLVFSEPPPLLTFVSDTISFKVSVDDFENNVVSTEDGKEVDISAFELLGNSGLPGFNYRQSVPIVDGVADFSDDVGPNTDTAGTYSVVVKEGDPALSTARVPFYVKYTVSARSKPFRVSAG